MRIGFVKPTFAGERRVALLPEHVQRPYAIERGFGLTLGIPDSEYEARGCDIMPRESVYRECGVIVNLKLTQPSDYPFLRDEHVLVGWTHPSGSGHVFFQKVARPRGITVLDLDNVTPTAYRGERSARLPIPRDFIRENSWLAGYASVTHALLVHGTLAEAGTPCAVLGAGNVSQGALAALTRHGARPRVFTRRNMSDFDPAAFKVIANGIESDGGHIITLDQQAQCRDVLFIDAAADADGTIEGMRNTSINSPTFGRYGNTYYGVNNSPSLLYRVASRVISRAFSEYAYGLPFDRIREDLT